MVETRAAEAGKIRLPVVGQDSHDGVDWEPPIGRLNPNCAFVQRAGAPIYDSCTYCSQELKNCLRFRGQWLTGVSIGIIVMMVLLPVGAVMKYVIAGVLISILGVYFRYVSSQSHRAIVNSYRIKQTQGRLASNERMAALGQISAVVMHEINNPLTYVEANVGTLTESLLEISESSGADASEESRAETVAEMAEMLNDLRSGVQKVRMIASDLRAVSRRGEDEKIFDLETSVRMAIRVAEARVRDGAVITSESPDSPLNVWGREDRLQQVVINLVVNAAQACEGHRTEDGSYIAKVTTGFESDLGSNMAILSIADNGPGIPVELREKVFEPFFTTKPTGEGTGLGLAICRQIVEEFGGELILRSSSSEGTTFEVRLPLGKNDSDSKNSKNSMSSMSSMNSMDSMEP